MMRTQPERRDRHSSTTNETFGYCTLSFPFFFCSLLPCCGLEERHRSQSQEPESHEKSGNQAPSKASTQLSKARFKPPQEGRKGGHHQESASQARSKLVTTCLPHCWLQVSSSKRGSLQPLPRRHTTEEANTHTPQHEPNGRLDRTTTTTTTKAKPAHTTPTPPESAPGQPVRPPPQGKH